MRDPNRNGMRIVTDEMNQGVALGGRQLTMTLSRHDYDQLTILATVNKTSPMTMLEFIVTQGLHEGWNSMLMARLAFVIANWVTWAI